MHFAIKGLFHRPAIVQPGERIGERLLAQLFAKAKVGKGERDVLTDGLGEFVTEAAIESLRGVVEGQLQKPEGLPLREKRNAKRISAQGGVHVRAPRAASIDATLVNHSATK